MVFNCCMTHNPNFKRNFYNRDDRRNEGENRVNYQIRVPQVRVIKDEHQLGVMSTDQARKLAQEEGLDLVEVAPDARPPVCKIMDYGRFKFEQKVKKKEAQKRQRESQVQLKEIRLRPGIADNDVDTKINQAKKFLEDGCKVQFNLQFRGQRELSHKDQGFAVMNKVVQTLNDLAVVDRAPKMEGNKLICCLSPK